MTKEAITISREGFDSTSDIREFDLHIDPTGEEAPDTLEVLVADYAACYIPALRVGAEQRTVGDLGRVEIDVTGDLNDDDKLEAVSFTVRVEADVTDEEADRVVERAFELCKVHDALKSSLHADVTVVGDAF